MPTDSIDMDELAEFALASIGDDLQAEADPAFLASLRRETRGTLSRTVHELHWFDMELDVGTIRLVHDGDLVHLVTNDAERFEAARRPDARIRARHGANVNVERSVRKVLAGRARGSSVAYLAGLPPFQKGVLEATASIPRGEVRPYNWVARQAGAPNAVRAAGTALGHNPVPFVVPCHRVVRADWQLGQYSAGGPGVKDRILRWEGVDMDRFSLLPPHARFVGDRTEMSFCLPACGGILEQPLSRLIFFHTAGEAEAEGFHACEWCQPV